MAEPTTTRIILRQEIAREVGMPAFRRFPTGFTIQDTGESGSNSASDSTGIRDARLTQERDYWINTWVYNVSTEETRLTLDFLQESNTLIPEYDWTTSPTTAHSIEIFSIYSPQPIHEITYSTILQLFD